MSPVIDLAAPMAVGPYRPIAQIAWAVKQRDGTEMFPSTGAAVPFCGLWIVVLGGVWVRQTGGASNPQEML